MRTSVQLTADAAPWPELVDFVVGAESLGVDAVWVAEAWGSDAASPLGYLAARTDRVRLGASVFQVGARSAVMTAQTAMTLNELSQGRFVLGLGVSGPQVMEGLHGVRFADPVGRMAETLDVIGRAFSGERIAYEGRHLQLPLPGGEGKPLRLSMRPGTAPPVYLASMLPRMLKLTGERAGLAGSVPASCRRKGLLTSRGGTSCEEHTWWDRGGRGRLLRTPRERARPGPVLGLRGGGPVDDIDVCAGSGEVALRAGRGRAAPR